MKLCLVVVGRGVDTTGSFRRGFFAGLQHPAAFLRFIRDLQPHTWEYVCAFISSGVEEAQLTAGEGGVIVKIECKGENRTETGGREERISRQEKVQMGRC